MLSPNHSNSKATPTLSVVIPMCNEQSNVGPLVAELSVILEDQKETWEIILVDDGSSDQTWNAILLAANNDLRIRGLSLSRNFGHQNAILAGMSHATGRAIITMDGDLQHPPQKIPELVEAWRAGYKVVGTRRIDSDDSSFFKRKTSRWFYRIFSFLSDLPLADGQSDFRLVDSQVAKFMLTMRDPFLYLRGIAHWVGFQRKTISYEANPRHSGLTKYSLSRMVRFSVSAVLSFSLKPLRLGIWLGLVMSFLAFAELVYILTRYLQGLTVTGWASILAVVSLMFGILFILIGILGMYIGEIVETLKNRPQFIVEQSTGIENET